MPAEWQARQLLFIASEPGRREHLSLSGRSVFTDFSSNGVAARATKGIDAMLKRTASDSKIAKHREHSVKLP